MEEDMQDEALDLSTRTEFECSTCFKSFKQKRYLRQHEKTHKPPAGVCKICQPPVSFQWRSGLVNHRAKVHGELPYLCAEDHCEKAFATNAELKEHGREKHSKCERCNGEFLNPGGLKLHRKKCVGLLDGNSENLPSSISIDSGVTSDESRDSRISEISSSSSLRSGGSRSRDDCEIKIKASFTKLITRDMRQEMFGLPTATIALIFANERGIATVDDELLAAILEEGQSLFERLCKKRASNSGIPHGPISPNQMEGPIPSQLSNVCVTLTFSPNGDANPQVSFVGSLLRTELFQDLKRFGKDNHSGVLQVGDFYMALVFENDFLYVVNPGIGSSKECRDSSDLPVSRLNGDNISLLKCHRRGWHVLVDDLIASFKFENPNVEFKYKILPMSILSTQEWSPLMESLGL